MPESRTPRERIVYAAAQSVRERGVAATGLRGVVAAAGAPRGSLQHYFPGGKDQLVTEALRWSADFAVGCVRNYVNTATAPTPAGLFAAMAKQWRDEFAHRGFHRGCPLVAAAADLAGTDPSLRASIDAAFESWLAAVRDALRQLGVPAGRARSLALVMISSLEGAIMLARTRHDPTPLTVVVRELRPLLDGPWSP
ncbi:MAG TPA: TetR/AcrR family transcriptional regulator [Jatrophihabitans sp.]|nr:TetR/AcrR family transcriptional regulator [Jatrophihabitans sp.]